MNAYCTHLKHSLSYPNMNDSNIAIQQEADLDPTNQSVPHGYKRTMAGNLRKIGKPARKPHDPNNFAPLGERTRFYPYGDEIVVKVDRFADEATCRSCAGTGHSDSTCPSCGGNKGSWYHVDGTRDTRSTVDRRAMKFTDCADCRAAQYSNPILRSTGRIPCKDCKGQGQAMGSIAISTAYEDQPTTGIVLAIGPQCKRIDRGDRIMFARFCGQEYEFDGRKYRIMKENYPMGKIVGKDEVRVRDAATLG